MRGKVARNLRRIAKYDPNTAKEYMIVDYGRFKGRSLATHLTDPARRYMYLKDIFVKDKDKNLKESVSAMNELESTGLLHEDMRNESTDRNTDRPE